MNTVEKVKVQLFHEFINEQINKSNVVQSEIAKSLGFDQPNIISMFKSGKTRVPLRVIPGLAKILDIDPKFMLRMAMFEYQPETLKAVEETFSGVITANEKEIINEIRRLTNNSNPMLRTTAHKEAIAEFVEKLMKNNF